MNNKPSWFFPATFTFIALLFWLNVLLNHEGTGSAIGTSFVAIAFWVSEIRFRRHSRDKDDEVI